ncbi:RecX family transcriptional regulator [Kitasatospora paranensis]|uniref:Regulatory protein RecX n=1 Tax=Kitasatospora paranensis TaxID=258053 RepID=A0ABW2G1K7_9ACTN
MHDPARPSGPAVAAAGSDDSGPPDWFAAAALPEDRPRDDASTEGAAGAPALTDVPGLRTAAELAGGRRRRRTALAPEADPHTGSAADPSAGPAGDGPAPARPADGDGPPEASTATARSGRGARAAQDTDPESRARDICLRLLTGTPRTRRQLADALRKREIPDDVATGVLDRFEEVGLIDDGAFAEAWVDARHAQRGLARRALGRELRNRGVSGELVEAALTRVDPEDEAASARVLVDRRLPATRGLEPQVRIRRLVAMLARRGYAEGLAFRVVREAMGEEDTLGEEGEGFGEDW